MITTAQLLDKVKRERRENPPEMPSAEALIEKAREALRRRQKNGPRLLLEAVDCRIRELEPDCADPWLAAQQIAKKRSLPGIEAGYRGVMLLKGDVDRDGHYDSAVGRASYEAAEVLLYILSNDQVDDV